MPPTASTIKHVHKSPGLWPMSWDWSWCWVRGHGPAGAGKLLHASIVQHVIAECCHCYLWPPHQRRRWPKGHQTGANAKFEILWDVFLIQGCVLGWSRWPLSRQVANSLQANKCPERAASIRAVSPQAEFSLRTCQSFVTFPLSLAVPLYIDVQWLSPPHNQKTSKKLQNPRGLATLFDRTAWSPGPYCCTSPAAVVAAEALLGA